MHLQEIMYVRPMLGAKTPLPQPNFVPNLPTCAPIGHNYQAYSPIIKSNARCVNIMSLLSFDCNSAPIVYIDLYSPYLLTVKRGNLEPPASQQIEKEKSKIGYGPSAIPARQGIRFMHGIQSSSVTSPKFGDILAVPYAPHHFPDAGALLALVPVLVLVLWAWSWP